MLVVINLSLLVKQLVKILIFVCNLLAQVIAVFCCRLQLSLERFHLLLEFEGAFLVVARYFLRLLHVVKDFLGVLPELHFLLFYVKIFAEYLELELQFSSLANRIIVSFFILILLVHFHSEKASNSALHAVQVPEELHDLAHDVLLHILLVACVERCNVLHF